MNHTIIFGASDDLIEIEGHLREEFGGYISDDEKLYIACSDGTLLSVSYDGEWKFHVDRQGALFEKIIPGVGEDGKHSEYPEATSCSDIVVFKEGLTWIAKSETISK